MQNSNELIVRDGALGILASDISKTESNLAEDTKSDPILLDLAVKRTKDKNDGMKYGVLRCDYEYIPTRGDPGEASSFSSDVEIRKVEGWTFEAVQRGTYYVKKRCSISIILLVNLCGTESVMEFLLFLNRNVS